MPVRERLTIALDSLELRLIAMLAATPVDAVFWTVFERKQKAIEAGARGEDLEFVRIRISGMLAARNLAPGFPDERH